jgi:hypothetical protein
MDFHHRTSSSVRNLVFASVLALALVVYYLWSGFGSLPVTEPFIHRVRVTSDPVIQLIGILRQLPSSQGILP